MNIKLQSESMLMKMIKLCDHNCDDNDAVLCRLGPSQSGPGPNCPNDADDDGADDGGGDDDADADADDDG